MSDYALASFIDRPRAMPSRARIEKRSAVGPPIQSLWSLFHTANLDS
jgi:hypothetical protein